MSDPKTHEPLLPTPDPRPVARPARPQNLRLRAADSFAGTRLLSPSGLEARLTRAGSLFSLRAGETLINQVLPGPAEDGLSRMVLRIRRPGSSAWGRLAGAGIAHRQRGPRAQEWNPAPIDGIRCRVTLALHETAPAWAWHVEACNDSGAAAEVDVISAQDLGLGNVSAVRNSEAFSSQYIDLLPLADTEFGWVIFARQNLAMEGGRHPWLGSACLGGAAAFCTDGSQFFGADHRLERIPAAVRSGSGGLPSVGLQYECAFAGLQSRPVTLQPGETTEVVFLARHQSDHPAASSREDLASLREILPADWVRRRKAPGLGKSRPPSLFVSAPWLRADQASEDDWAKWFPGPRRHEERGREGNVLSFFSGVASHVVARDKEAMVARPHGHILRSGSWQWIDSDQFGTTCYAAGIFAAQAYLGNPTFARLLPVVRDSLGIGRAAGQRVFVRRGEAWLQLGVPSAFAMGPGEARWIYRCGAETIMARVWCSQTTAACFLELGVAEGGRPCEFLITHTLALDTNEFDRAGTVRLDSTKGWAFCRPNRESVVGARLPGLSFAIAAADPGQGVRFAGDGPLYPDSVSRRDACVVLQSPPIRRLGVILCGSLEGTGGLAGAVAAARQEWRRGDAAAEPPPAPVRLGFVIPNSSPGMAHVFAAVARIDEVLPWFAHNAAIHFSAPHGLEQHGGAAWGVRDVCQGSLEWMLASREWNLARSALQKVFAQQYAHDGSWPQWFMHPPFESIQQADSHGDVCFWPVKALCDYVEASNDLAFLSWRTGFTNHEDFSPEGPEETLLQHCDRVIALCESRFVPGTALVNYGEGDWDDTLQPADPAMREKMVSSWTVGLSFHTFRLLTGLYSRLGDIERQRRVETLLLRMRRDFVDHLMPEAIVAGFLVTEADGNSRALLHPSDEVTKIRYRLLPMTRAVLAELFTAEEASRHMSIVHRELLYPDGVRLMSEPAAYHGGRENLFKRADTAANVGREIGLQYVHAHLRYAEAMAKMGEADRLWTALQVVNPVGLAAVVPHAAARQSNVYFSSSDADFNDRYEAAQRWPELRTGAVAVRGGWRLYSSGPGMFIHKIRSCLIGLRESFGEVVFDPVLAAKLDGLVAFASLLGRPVEVRFVVKGRGFGPTKVTVNGVVPDGARRESNPYREGGLCFREDALNRLLSAGSNFIQVEL